MQQHVLDLVLKYSYIDKTDEINNGVTYPQAVSLPLPTSTPPCLHSSLRLPATAIM